MGKRPRDRAFDVATSLMTPMARVVERCSLVGNSTFFEPERFPWVRTLEDHWRDIRTELDAVLVHRDDIPAFHEITADVADISTDRDWKTFFFYGYGFTAGKNVARCPETARLLREIPGMTTAMFSILAPHKKIPPHGGPYKGVLRFHLGLLVPDPPSACGIRVGGDVRHWAEGKSLVFDDTYEHEAWNDTDGTRVVLFVDVKRPLAGRARWLNETVLRLIGFSPFIQDAKARHNAWERRFETMRGAA